MEAVGTILLTVAVNQAVKSVQKTKKYNTFKEKAKRVLFRSYKNKSKDEDQTDELSWSLIEHCVIDSIV